MDTLNVWRAARGLRPLSIDEVPSIGFIADGIGAGFLLRTDTCVGMLDGFIAAPGARAKAVHGALRRIAEELCYVAGRVGVKRLVVMTAEHGILTSLRRHLGFDGGSRFYVLERELLTAEARRAA